MLEHDNPEMPGRMRMSCTGLTLRHCGVVVAVGLLVLASACATNPVTGKREFVLISEADELEMGRQADAEIQQQMGVYEDFAIQEYVEEIGYSLAAVSHRSELDWHFTVVDSPAINAFALPGGYIYLTRGIMAYLSDEAELAGVLGHEIGHVTARHSVQAITRAQGAQYGLVLGQIFVPPMRSNPYTGGVGDLAGSGLGLLFLKFGRDDEIQADRLGAEYALGGGWHPQGVADMLSTLARVNTVSDRRGVPNWLSTHPDPEARVAEVGPIVSEMLAAADPAVLRVDRSGYLDRIDGLRFGENPEDGIVRGNEFLHPPLRFAIEFPEGWAVQNSEAVVLAKQPGEEIYMLLQLAEHPGGNLRTVARTTMEDAGYQFRSGRETTINGLDAYLGTYGGHVDGLGEIVAQMAHIRHDRNVYAVGGIGPVGDMARVEREVDRSIRSFRSLSRDEADSILPNEIALYVAREGDTWQQIAQRGGDDVVQAATLAIMNGYPVNEQPRPGDRLKIVVPGEPQLQDTPERGRRRRDRHSTTRRAPTYRSAQ